MSVAFLLRSDFFNRPRLQLSHIKTIAATVSMASLREAGDVLEDLTTEKLQLARDSELYVINAAESRESEMRDILDRRYRQYNQKRLASDKKEDTLAKMIVELEALETFKAKEEKSSKVEDQASIREQSFYGDRNQRRLACKLALPRGHTADATLLMPRAFDRHVQVSLRSRRRQRWRRLRWSRRSSTQRRSG